MQEWCEARGCDVQPYAGKPARLLRGLVAMVMPELQRRGLCRTEYEGRFLREKLGLRPVINRYSRQRQAAE
jgi:N-acetyl-S-(2-succino)cysteine monooxygenase